jgi:hypothetical protein
MPGVCGWWRSTHILLWVEHQPPQTIGVAALASQADAASTEQAALFQADI